MVRRELKNCSQNLRGQRNLERLGRDKPGEDRRLLGLQGRGAGGGGDGVASGAPVSTAPGDGGDRTEFQSGGHRS